MRSAGGRYGIVKKLIPILLTCLLIAQLAACSGKTAPEPTPEIAVSAEYTTPVPTAEPTPEPEMIALVDYDLGNGVLLRLPEGYTADIMDDGSFFLTGSTALVSGAWYDEDYIDYLGYEWPETAEEAVNVLIPEGFEIMASDGDENAYVVEYAYDGQTTRWAAYTVIERGDGIWWKIEFLCPESLYESMRPQFTAWGALMELPSVFEYVPTYTMYSMSGLFTLELPYTCIVIDESTTAEDLLPFGMGEEDASAFLSEILERADGADVVYRADFGAMLTVKVMPDAGFTQAEMLDKQDELDIVGSLVGTDYTYEGVVMVEGNPNMFYLVRVGGDYNELSFITCHDAADSFLAFSFVGFSDDEARDILKTLTMLEPPG